MHRAIERFALELKLKKSECTLQEGLDQLSGYLDRLGMKEGYWSGSGSDPEQEGWLIRGAA